MKLARELLFPLIAVLAAFIVGGIMVLIVGDNPIETYALLLGSALSWPDGIGYSLFYATPLIFTGLAVLVAFRCGLLNIGAEGQLYVAAFVTAWVGITLGSLPAWVLLPSCFLAAVLSGAVWGAPLAAGTARRDPSLPPLDVIAQAPLAIGEDVLSYRELARPGFALYIGGMGAKGRNFYNTLTRRYGFEKEAETIQDLYLDGKKDEAAAAVPAEMLEKINLVGPEAREASFR